MSEPSDPDQSAVGGEGVVSPGAMLREARIAAGLTQEDVGREMRQDVNLVVALERDDFSIFSAPIFISGYLRSYARAVNVAPEAVLAAYHGLGSDAPPPLAPSTRAPDLGGNLRLARSTVIGFSVVVLVAVLIVWWQARGSIAFGVKPIVTAGGASAMSLPAPAPSAVAPMSTPAATPPPSARAAPQTGQGTLTLRFGADSWAEVKDASGRPVFQDLGKAGTEYTVAGVPPLTVLLGYSPGVAVEYNGAPFDTSPYVRQYVANFTVGATASR